MKLYSLPGCPYCKLVLSKLKELNLDYEEVVVPAAHSRRREVKRVSDQTFVPVLVDGEQVLTDENEILAYLETNCSDG